MMRRTNTRCIWRYRALALALAAFGVVRAEAQSRVPNLPVVRDLVIDAAANDLSPVTWLAVARNEIGRAHV